MASLTKKIIKGRAYYYLRECQRVNGKPKIIWQKYLQGVETKWATFTGPPVSSAPRFSWAIWISSRERIDGILERLENKARRFRLSG